MVRAFLGSMAGRIFIILLLGVVVSASIATGLADVRRRTELQRAHLEMTADRIHDFVAAIGDGRPPILAPGGLVNVDVAPIEARGDKVDPDLTRLLAQKIGANSGVVARTADLSVCAALATEPKSRAPHLTQRRCWLVDFETGGEPVRLMVDQPPRPASTPRALDPAFQVVLILAAALLSFFVARMAASPLNDLAQAASNLGRDLDRAPLAERGPSEVAAAAHAFNLMQAQLRQDLAQRRHMLAAITHDLQTPLTRLRLRLEKVEDEDLRERLVADLNAMRQLVQEGLDLARSPERDEASSVVDLDSLVGALAEDEADAGQPVSFAGESGLDVRIRPAALRRALANLIDNAVRHGGSADVLVQKVGSKAGVLIRDHGPGVPADQLEAVFQPFARLEDSRSRETGGAGLGLTIARTLIEQSGGRLILRNHPDGGLEAVVTLPPA